jgi:hypothetical protein
MEPFDNVTDGEKAAGMPGLRLDALHDRPSATTYSHTLERGCRGRLGSGWPPLSHHHGFITPPTAIGQFQRALFMFRLYVLRSCCTDVRSSRGRDERTA